MLKNFTFDLLMDIFTLLVVWSNKEISWKMVFLGKITGSKFTFVSISKLLEDNLWLSVATPVRKDWFSKFVLWK